MKKFLFILLFMTKLAMVYSQHVGIGTNTPVFKLDVSGSINSDSLYRINGQPVLSVKGNSNTFVGINSGLSNTSGNFNTAIGSLALYSDTSGSSNTASGYTALFSNSSGTGNTATGTNALYYNRTGNYNTATGFYALYWNTTGVNNVANGGGALQANTSGNHNAAFGDVALSGNTSGSYNTAVGHQSVYRNTTGTNNVGMGRNALYYNYTGSNNTAVGSAALHSTQQATGNTAFGYSAGSGYDNGWYNTFLGADADANAGGYYNSIAIGNTATITAPLQVRIGGSFITSIGGYQNWTNISDGRFKKNVTENVKGLDFILKLRPVTYNLDVTALSEKLQEGRTKENNNDLSAFAYAKEKMLLSGFVAQEVEQASKETGYEFSGVDKPKNANDFYGLRYAEFVVPLVKAIQEQQQIIRELQLQIDELRKKIGD